MPADPDTDPGRLQDLLYDAGQVAADRVQVDRAPGGDESYAEQAKDQGRGGRSQPEPVPRAAHWLRRPPAG